MATVKVKHDFKGDKDNITVFVDGVRVPDVTDVITRSYHDRDDETVLTIKTDKFIRENEVHNED